MIVATIFRDTIGNCRVTRLRFKLHTAGRGIDLMELSAQVGSVAPI
jgi:hypothetical protein